MKPALEELLPKNYQPMKLSLSQEIIEFLNKNKVVINTQNH
jgi:hypothetical protein